MVHLEVDDDFVRYFSASSTFRTDTDFASEKLSGPYGVEIVASNPDDAGVFTPSYLSTVQELTVYLRNHERTRNVVSLSDVINEVAKAFDPGVKITDRSSNELAQLFLSYELSLQEGQSTTDIVNLGKTSSRISVLLEPSSSLEIREFVQEIGAWSNAHSQFSIEVTGEIIPTAYLSPVNIRSMSIGIAISLLFSSAVIGFYLKSWRVAIVIFASIVVPVLAGFGVWGWFFSSIGLATTVVIAVTIGVVVDDSIHIVYRSRDGMTQIGLDPREAAAYAVHRVGTAIVATTLVLGAGFSVLMASGFEMNSSFGVCVVLILILALSFDLSVLPKMLVWAGSKSSVEDEFSRS
jgi:predicted RND superfamily exporter protein